MPYVSRALFVTPEADSSLINQAQVFADIHGIDLKVVELRELLTNPAAATQGYPHLVAAADDSTLAPLLEQARALGLSVGILPLDSRSRIADWFKLPRDMKAALALAFSAEATPIDLLYCNEELVLGSVVVGETPFLNPHSRIFRERPGSWRRTLHYTLILLRIALRNLFAIHPFPITITTGKEKVFNTAITGLVAIENDVRGAAARLVNTVISVQDAKVSTILIAPKSIMEYLAFLVTALVLGEQKVSRLPKAISLIKSATLKIVSPRSMAYSIDGQKRSAASIELAVREEAVRLNLSESYYQIQEGQRDDKELVKTENLPTNEARLEMIQRKLPLFTRALEEDFKELFLQLRDSARLSAPFVLLLLLSAVVATHGLFLSSAAVIIGAMVLAPLMAPIISLAMALLRGDRVMLRSSSLTIAIGVALALGTAAFISLLIPIERITPEIAGRLNPNLLDLGVAIAAGIAGAYAHARESVIKSLPGVAIAVALVPPLCVAGIGIGWMDLHVISGAALLFITNLVGIALAAALTFLVLGYAPLLRAKRGLAISLLVLAVVSIPLSVSFHNIYRHWMIERDAQAAPFQVNGKLLQLKALQVSLLGDKIVLRSDITSRQEIGLEELKALKRLLSERWGREVVLEVTPRLLL